MYLRHQMYTLYYRDVCILVFLHVFAYFMLLRCMLKFKRLACGSDDVTQYNTMQCLCLLYECIIGLPGSSTVNNFLWEGAVGDVVSQWRRLEDYYYFRLFSNSWKLIESTSKNLSKFVSGEDLTSSVSFCLRHCYLANDNLLFHSKFFKMWLWPSQ